MGSRLPLIAVTGASGFVGQHLTRWLLERDHRVLAITRGDNRTQAEGRRIPDTPGVADLRAAFAGAHAVVGVDTGLTHFATALGARTVGIFIATDPAATGLYGSPRAMNVGGARETPKVNDVIAAVERLTA